MTRCIFFGLLMLTIGCAQEHFPPAKPHTTHAHNHPHNSSADGLILVNESNLPVYFTGYGWKRSHDMGDRVKADSSHAIAAWVASARWSEETDEWVTERVGRCGTGMVTVELAPGGRQPLSSACPTDKGERAELNFFHHEGEWHKAVSSQEPAAPGSVYLTTVENEARKPE